MTISNKLPVDIDVKLGVRIRRGRRLKGLTQERLAERIGVSAPQLQKYEIGQNRVSASRLVAIAAAIEQPIIWFFGEVQ